jgi:sterol desaturase/sphingolipid hydroxylase (fatty acid hydroxylase superfamily)
MTLATQLTSSVATVGVILGAMAVIALIETAIPLHARGRWNRTHLGPNLALTGITFATNIAFNAALVLALAWLQANRLGLLNRFELQPWLSVALVVLTLDFSFYVAHVSMHKIPGFWRFHCVHHADPAVDVTTTVRQHPVEGVIRYAFMGAFAFALGAGPAAFAVYRTGSAVSGLLEHANIRVPFWLNDPLALVFTWPNMHKVHHSRDARFTDTNYGNIVSFWDRLFSTFTPARHGASIVYGLVGLDDPVTQTTMGLLALPLRAGRSPSRAATESR